ncbi:MAPEG family protein [Brevundimonas sp.]|uniref:MAPEG family protein n=1 Tax=Brevundimonas sp. TaxID=1871086 RepID=UPI002D58808C|nr:MAPEG family protein [Brevundimonas sp.]HYD26257.1 MAPEG family protein [Brevundimonas sp.]
MPGMTALHAAGFWSGLLILVLIVLSVRVVMTRRRQRVILGDGGDEVMIVAARRFGNAAEYTPVAIAALILLALIGWQAWIIHLIGAAFFVGRVVHPLGLAFGKGPPPARVIGMTLTWLPLLAAAVLLVIGPFLA